MRVLCVDDDRVNLLLFELSCESVGGIDLRCAESEAQALTAVAGWRPDLLVLDLHLRETTGHALRARLQAALGEPMPPSVLYTAEFAATVHDEASRAGFTHLWSKPVTNDELRQALNAHLAAHGSVDP